MVSTENIYTYELFAMYERLHNCLTLFQQGALILVGDDGARENEIDLVFHASGATPANVNFALTHAKGLLCVSLSHDLADTLGFSLAPQLPGGMSHTNFTLSVDAKHGVTTGISASDRAHTISLMINSQATHRDFISPGHVFPLRAMGGGLLARAGHTEALYELCRMAHMPYAAVMCEILKEDGEALTANDFLQQNCQLPQFKNIPFISTVDILWSRIFFEKSEHCSFILSSHFDVPSHCNKVPLAIYLLQAGLETHLTTPTIISIYSHNITPQNIRISITNSLFTWDNGVSSKNCAAEISLFNLENILEILPVHIAQFCDLSAKEGLRNTKSSVKRVLSQFRSLQFLNDCYFKEKNFDKIIAEINFMIPEDKLFLQAVCKIAN